MSRPLDVRCHVSVLAGKACSVQHFEDRPCRSRLAGCLSFLPCCSCSARCHPALQRAGRCPRKVCCFPLGEPPRLRAKVGMFGGTPAGGMQFGAAHGSDAHVPCATMLGACGARRR